MNKGERLLQLRKCSGLTMEYVSKQLGISKPTIMKYEKGIITNIPSDKIEALAEMYGSTPGYIMGWEEDQLAGVQGIIKLERRKIPVLGSIACGDPITAEQRMEIEIDTDIQCDYALRCKGVSMEPLFKDGDLVLVRKQERVETGEIAVVLIDDEATLKRVHYISGGILLTAENTAAYQPRVYAGAEAEMVRIIGKAVAFQRLL